LGVIKDSPLEGCMGFGNEGAHTQVNSGASTDNSASFL
jgi:hypothetical protein